MGLSLDPTSVSCVRLCVLEFFCHIVRMRHLVGSLAGVRVGTLGSCMRPVKRGFSLAGHGVFSRIQSARSLFQQCSIITERTWWPECHHEVRVDRSKACLPLAPGFGRFARVRYPRTGPEVRYVVSSRTFVSCCWLREANVASFRVESSRVVPYAC